MHDDADPLRRKIWIFAAVLALGAHLAFAAFAIARMSEPDDDDLGAPGIEIVIEIERLSHVLGVLVRQLDARLLPPEKVWHEADEARLGELMLAGFVDIAEPNHF